MRFGLLRSIHYFIIFCKIVKTGTPTPGLKKLGLDSGPGLESRLRGLQLCTPVLNCGLQMNQTSLHGQTQHTCLSHFQRHNGLGHNRLVMDLRQLVETIALCLWKSDKQRHTTGDHRVFETVIKICHVCLVQCNGVWACTTWCTLLMETECLG